MRWRECQYLSFVSPKNVGDAYAAIVVIDPFLKAGAGFSFLKEHKLEMSNRLTSIFFIRHKLVKEKGLPFLRQPFVCGRKKRY